MKMKWRVRARFREFWLFIALFLAIGIAQTGFNAWYNNLQNGNLDAQLATIIGNAVTYVQWGQWTDVGERDLDEYAYEAGNKYGTFAYLINDKGERAGIVALGKGNRRFFINETMETGTLKESNEDISR